MTNQMKAVLMIADYPALKNILRSVIDVEKEMIYWDQLNYHSLSSGQKTAISWAHSIWTNQQPSIEMNYEDLFDAFGSIDRELQQTILTAFAIRHDVFGLPSVSEQRVKALLSKMSGQLD